MAAHSSQRGRATAPGRNIVVENCQMLHPQGGDAVLVDNIANANGRRTLPFSQDTVVRGEC